LANERAGNLGSLTAATPDAVFCTEKVSPSASRYTDEGGAVTVPVPAEFNTENVRLSASR
jgi:hypothetical protein